MLVHYFFGRLTVWGLTVSLRSGSYHIRCVRISIWFSPCPLFLFCWTDSSFFSYSRGSAPSAKSPRPATNRKTRQFLLTCWFVSEYLKIHNRDQARKSKRGKENHFTFTKNKKIKKIRPPVFGNTTITSTGSWRTKSTFHCIYVKVNV